jgi:hypothetical protein
LGPIPNPQSPIPIAITIKIIFHKEKRSCKLKKS